MIINYLMMLNCWIFVGSFIMLTRLLTPIVDPHCWPPLLTPIVDPHCWPPLLTPIVDPHCLPPLLTWLLTPIVDLIVDPIVEQIVDLIVEQIVEPIVEQIVDPIVDPIIVDLLLQELLTKISLLLNKFKSQTNLTTFIIDWFIHVFMYSISPTPHHLPSYKLPLF